MSRRGSNGRLVGDATGRTSRGAVQRVSEGPAQALGRPAAVPGRSSAADSVGERRRGRVVAAVVVGGRRRRR